MSDYLLKPFEHIEKAERLLAEAEATDTERGGAGRAGLLVQMALAHTAIAQAQMTGRMRA